MVKIAVMQRAGLVGGALVLGGCSFLYNPSGLPNAAIDGDIIEDAGIEIDQPTIVSPGELALAAVGPLVLLEGQGTGGSRPAVLAITGSNLAPEAVVTLVSAASDVPAPLIEVDNEHAVRSPSGTSIAVPVTLPIDVARGAGEIALIVQVTQPGSEGAVVTRMLDGMVTLRTLPELSAPPVDSAMLYSRVALDAALSIAPGGAAPLVIRAVSSIELRDVHVDASQRNGGAGGAAGGVASMVGAGPGGGRPGGLLTGGVIASGSGGGYSTTGGTGRDLLGNVNAGGAAAGDELLLLANNGSSGGGGGANAGGGGGGAIEITAGGTLTAGTITANGAAGGQGVALLGGPGGGGSGGKILLRAGATATITSVTATGGAGGPQGSSGISAGGGAGGRLRYDVGALAGTPALPAASRPGVSFSIEPGDNPLIVTDSRQGFAVTTTVSAIPANNVFDVYVFDAAMANTDSDELQFVTPVTIFTPKLGPGFNRICVTPNGRNPLTDVTATTCIDVAYVP
jgi:hypothetical protein